VASYKSLPLNNVWRKDINCSSGLDWHSIWLNITLSSRNLNHQMTHYNFTHRSYFTPQRLYQMKFRDDPYCGFCSSNKMGTDIHMVWQFPEVDRFWLNISSILSNLLARAVPHSQHLLLLNDTSSLDLTVNEKRLLLAGLTAVKKIIACRWKSPHMLSMGEWLLNYKEIAQMELAKVWLHHAKAQNVSCWSSLLQRICALL